MLAAPEMEEPTVLKFEEALRPRNDTATNPDVPDAASIEAFNASTVAQRHSTLNDTGN